MLQEYATSSKESKKTKKTLKKLTIAERANYLVERVQVLRTLNQVVLLLKTPLIPLTRKMIKLRDKTSTKLKKRSKKLTRSIILGIVKIKKAKSLRKIRKSWTTQIMLMGAMKKVKMINRWDRVVKMMMIKTNPRKRKRTTQAMIKILIEME